MRGELCYCPEFSLGRPQRVDGLWLRPLQTCDWALWLAARDLAAQGRLRADAISDPSQDPQAAAVLRLLLQRCCTRTGGHRQASPALWETLSADPAACETLLAAICLQAGIALPPPDANPDLLQPRRAATDPPAEPNVLPQYEDLVAAVAANTGQSMQELWRMPIRQFEALRRAVDRSLRHRLLLQAALSGRLKKEVPIPGWQLEGPRQLPQGWKKL